LDPNSIVSFGNLQRCLAHSQTEDFYTGESGRESQGGALVCRLYKPEKIMTLLQHAELAVANGSRRRRPARKLGISDQTFTAVARSTGRRKVDQAKRLNALEPENVKLKAVDGGALAGKTNPAGRGGGKLF
jgi:hypothetical protein